jgi:hypothetical protein
MTYEIHILINLITTTIGALLSVLYILLTHIYLTYKMMKKQATLLSNFIIAYRIKSDLMNQLSCKTEEAIIKTMLKKCMETGDSSKCDPETLYPIT